MFDDGSALFPSSGFILSGNDFRHAIETSIDFGDDVLGLCLTRFGNTREQFLLSVIQNIASALDIALNCIPASVGSQLSGNIFNMSLKLSYARIVDGESVFEQNLRIGNGVPLRHPAFTKFIAIASPPSRTQTDR